MAWIFLLLAAAQAGSVRVTIEVGPDGSRLVDAVHVTEEAVESAGDLMVVDGAGRVIARAPIPDPRLRSVIYPEGGGEAVYLERSLIRVSVPWPDQAETVQLSTQSLIPRVAPPMSVEPIQSSGPAAERLDLVFLGDGYTDDELPKYAQDVDRMVAYLQSIEPYNNYTGLFNIWRIDEASAESGVSHDESVPTVERDTAYGCYYGCYGIDRLVCCNESSVLGAVNTYVPEADGVMVLVNDPVYGGSGGFNFATSYVGEYGEQVSAHELGHSLVGLWDEYSYGTTGPSEVAVNCSEDPGSTPWQHWLDETEIDAYPVCSYTNFYRPTDSACMMRTLQDGYCKVCREQVVLAMYSRLPSLISSADPAPGGEVTVRQGARPVSLSVASVGADEGMLYQWQLDGEVLDVTGPELELTGCEGYQGTLTVTVSDPTPWVRSDPTRSMTETVSWLVDTDKCGKTACGCQATLPVQGAMGLWLGGLWVVGRRRRA